MEIFSSNAIPRGSCFCTLFGIVLISTAVSLNMRMDLDNFLEQTKRSSLAFRKKQKEAEEKALRNNDLADKRCRKQYMKKPRHRRKTGIKIMAM
ncbi:hypothetical protein GUITHDRAFT_114068 [Guillardia theta CCMP2712]|uniref:Uncharacterized protein n=1 Tax=Guillardia theta (strain CCMP2712) TaxID=905079 RepID=L1IUC6_GUITC|nr:hypothetical protein GUITHDRAFT_114068 [Guillardia theta CCMP2712]EKX39818.1 hypothetical protein GUITHDRAFT_114068 [Guillardia theta CCMP2712]|eukprot:XP_005826798.1 hypothetical protein GUITHDRAFT_114068 [Guillardia theta CCMP2712]